MKYIENTLVIIIMSAIINYNWATSATGGITDLSTDGTHLYTSNLSNGTISKYNLSNGSLVTTFSLTINPYSVIYHNSYFYATGAGKQTIYKINASNGSLVDSSWATLTGDLRGAIILGNYMYVINGSGVARIDMTTKSVNNTWCTGLVNTNNIRVDITGNYGFVGCLLKIVLINMNTGSVINSNFITVDHPYAMDVYGFNLFAVDKNTVIKKYNISTGSIVDASWGTGFTNPYCALVVGQDLYAVDTGKIVKISLLNIPCFKEGTQIVTDKGYLAIEKLAVGDLIQTSQHGFVPIHSIGFRTIEHKATEQRDKNQLYQCSQEQYPELIEDLIITGSHSILVNAFEKDQKEQTINVLGDIYITEKRYRLPVCVDERAIVYPHPGTYTVYHIALEHEDIMMNYGIYANGLLVESCSKRYLQEFSEMELKL